MYGSISDHAKIWTPWLGTNLEDKMRVAFRDSTTQTVWEVLSQDNVMQGERDGRPMRQVRDCHRCRCTSMLVQQYDVGQASRVARAHELRKDSVASVKTNRCRHQQTDLFGEGGQSAGGRS